METPLRSILDHKGDSLFRVEPTATASEAIRIMNDANVGCVLVIDTDGLVGVFTERDVLRRVVDQGLDPGAVPVGDVMTREVITVAPSITVEEALTVCTNKRVRHLPVQENGRLVGLVSIGDLVRSVIKDQEQIIDGLIEYIYGPRMHS